jgi:peptidoglycan/LPS O-acetylase OafA/YrhL
MSDERAATRYSGEDKGLMNNTTLPDPKFRKLFIAAFGLALAVQGWAAYLRLTQHPAPKWTQGLPTVFIEIVFGFYFLLVPMPGMTPNTRRAFIALFFGISAVMLIMFFY